MVGGASRTRLPITPSLLRKLKELWSASGAERDTKLMWAACCLCVFGFMRAGELTVPNEEEFDEAVHLCVGRGAGRLEESFHGESDGKTVKNGSV